MADEVTCRICGELKNNKEFPQENGKIRRRTCWTCRGRQERAKLKLDMLNNLGYSCSCCGESNVHFLTLDHVKNDGAAAREQYNEQQIYRKARRDGWPREFYQVLCMNCNFAKGHFGECPHKLNISADDSLAKLRLDASLIEREYGPITDAQRQGLAAGPQVAAKLRTLSAVFGKKVSLSDLQELVDKLKK